MLDNNAVINGLCAIRRFFEIGLPSQSVIFDSYQNIIDGAIELINEQRQQIIMLVGAQHVIAEVLKDYKPDTNIERNSFTVIDIKTGEYPDLEAIALHEDWAQGLCYCDMEGFAIEEDGSLVLMDECNNVRYCPVGRFEIKWGEE